MIQHHDGHILFSFDPGRFGNQQSNKVDQDGKSNREVPELTFPQLHALETLSGIAEEHCVRIAAEPGDILFINNWALVHGREAYKDDDAQNNRHVVRLWLHNTELGWKIPASMKIPWKAAFGSIDGDKINGTDEMLKSCNRNYPVVPTKEYRAPKYTAGSAAFLLEDSDEDGS